MTAKSQLLHSAAAIALVFGYTGVANAQSYATAGSGVETVTITASRSHALAVKKDAANVLEIQPLSEIRKLPDINLAEALQRIPGISMESDSGEGRFINIRGMDADLNGTSYDGVRLTASNPSSPQGGGRAVAFDAFPPGIIGGIEVIKSLTPDIDAEGLGGIVNLLPRTMPADKEMLVDASVGTGVESLRGSPVWDGDVTAGTRFGPSGSVSAIASYAFHQDWRGIDDIEEDYLNYPDKTYDDLQLRWYKYHRTRQGAGGGLTFDVSDDTQLYVRALHAGYTEISKKHRLQLNNLGDDGTGNEPVPAADGTFTVPTAQAQQRYTYAKEIVANDLVEAGGHTELGGDILADFRASWTKGSDKFPYNYGFTFQDNSDIALTYNNTADPAHPSFATTDGTDVTDPSLYKFKNGSNGPSHNSDTETGGVLNVTAPVGLIADDGTLKFGGSIRERVRRADASSGDLAANSSLLAVFAAPNDQIYYDNHYNIGPFADLKALAALPQDVPAEDPSTYEHDNENVFAGYAQYSFDSGPLGVLGGVRVEKTEGTYRANAVDANDNSLGLVVNKHDYTNWFPDLNAKYQVSDQFQLRAAFSTSIARPGFNQITAARSVDTDANIISEGNPALKANTADNFDFTAEYYLPDGGLMSGGLFYKAFSNYIIPTTETLPASDFPQYTFNGGNTVELDSFANIGSAHAQGLEVSYIQQFTGLPAPLDGLGFDGNFTYISSRGQIRPGESHTLPQTSPFNYNAAVFYEEGPVNLRLGASYVSRNLWAVGGDANSDLYSQPRFRLDFGGSYEINDNFEYYVDVKNITNTKLEFTQGTSKNYPVQREFYDVDYLTGIRAHF